MKKSVAFNPKELPRFLVTPQRGAAKVSGAGASLSGDSWGAGDAGDAGELGLGVFRKAVGLII